MTDLDPRIRMALLSVNPTTENPAWHGCPTALGVLRGVSPAVAVWRPYPSANNIREIALHIAFWQNSVANRLSGTSILVGFKQRKTSWALMLDEIDVAQWKSEVALVRSTHQRLVEALTAFDPTLLDEPASTRTKQTMIAFVHGVAEHTLYHTAQMELTKTLARERGVAHPR